MVFLKVLNSFLIDATLLQFELENKKVYWKQSEFKST